MDLGRLDDRRGGRDEPMKALALAELRDRSCRWIATRNRFEGGEVGLNRGRIHVRSQRPEAIRIEADLRRQEPRGPAKEDDAGVQALAPLDPGNDPDDRVLDRMG